MKRKPSRAADQCPPSERAVDLRPPAERLAASVTRYRLAIELARGAIHLGRYGEALAHLDKAVQQ